MTQFVPHAPEGALPVDAGAQRNRRRVLLATVVGTTVEWYDFFIYAMMAALVFDQLFFAPGGGAAAGLASLATIGLSFLFRPLGAIIAGHFGDRVGRQPMLVATLVLMGASTTLIGFLPTYAVIGAGAPFLLVLLRILQGLSAGGEWGGAALLSVEHAPRDHRGLYGAFPQIGVPIGLLLSSAVLALVSGGMTQDEFMRWGWRIPFLLSAVLLAFGLYIRLKVAESPAFAEIAERQSVSQAPISEVLHAHRWFVFLAALTFAGNNAVGYMTTGGFVQRYATYPNGPVALARAPVLWAVTASAVVWLAATLFAGALSDRIGRRETYFIGWIVQAAAVIPLFGLVHTGRLGALFGALALLSIGLGLTYGAQSAFFAELFPAPQRYSGVAISYAVGAVLGGAFAPLIAQALLIRTGGTGAVTGYLLLMTAIGFVATLLLPRRDKTPLTPWDPA